MVVKLDTHRNSIIEAAPEAIRRSILSESANVNLVAGQSLVQPDVPIKVVWFPLESVVSLVTELETGGSAEAAVVGFEGFVGLNMFLGPETTKVRALTQVGGKAIAVDASLFRHHLQDERFRDVIGRYVQGLYEVTAQAVACQAYHSVEQRLAKWLLITQDRLTRHELPLTQEFLAAMLGVQRPTVTVAARLLHHTGMINYRHGKIVILDRDMLESAACECYRFVGNKMGIPPHS